MTEDNGKKLTLSAKPTLTMKRPNVSSGSEGRKVVQVEVRKKRFVNQQPQTKGTVIDEELARKLELLDKAKEHEAKRRQEEEQKEQLRQKQREEAEALRKQQEEEKAKALEAEKKAEAKKAEEEKAKEEKKVVKVEKEKTTVPNFTENEAKSSYNKHKEKKEDYDDDDEDFYAKKGKKMPMGFPF